ncbi:transmembrane protein 107 [Nothobranchius furzeri]|uniref:Transmembrane protein 107 n=1 Tax=Nothobranchius furzeri TaxID=105023 RepID=A0A9D2YV40_NOTFU|nr:transmembrane protein 107 [Nothobranchius furzeri]
MSAISSLVPARFLTITAHLVIVITIFWSRVRKKWFIFNLISFGCNVIATGVHASAAVALLFFLFEQWQCDSYWWILAVCSVLPACVEILLFIAVFGLKKKPL